MKNDNKNKISQTSKSCERNKINKNKKKQNKKHNKQEERK